MRLSDAHASEKRLALIAAAGFAALLLITFIAGLSGQKSSVGETSDERVFADLNQSPGQVEITLANEAYTLESTETGWVLPERGDFPVRPAPLSELLSALETARFTEARTQLPDRFDLLGLGDPTSGGNGALIRLPGIDDNGAIIGVKDDLTYGRRAGEVRSWRVSEAFPPLHAPNWWIDPDMIGLPRLREISKVQITLYDENSSLELLEADELTANEEAILFASQSIKLLDVRWYEAETMTPFAEHSIRYRDGSTLSLILLKHRGQVWAEISGSALQRKDLANERAFRLDPISASELLP